MEYLSKFVFVFLASLNKQVDADTLHNIKDILILATIWASLFLLTITV